LYELINNELARHIGGFVKRPALYRDFRAGDIRHSNANISKAERLVSYQPTHTIEQGMALAIEWYIANHQLSAIS